MSPPVLLSFLLILRFKRREVFPRVFQEEGRLVRVSRGSSKRRGLFNYDSKGSPLVVCPVFFGPLKIRGPSLVRGAWVNFHLSPGKSPLGPDLSPSLLSFLYQGLRGGRLFSRFLRKGSICSHFPGFFQEARPFPKYRG